MIGVIPAAGDGKRMSMGLKPLIQLKGRYLIEYPLLAMKKVGIKRVIIIEKPDTVSTVIGYEYEDMKLEYVSQTETKGIAHAIAQTRVLVGDEHMLIILGDIIYRGDDLITAKRFFTWNRQSLYAVFCLKAIGDKRVIRQSYGVITEQFGKPAQLIEKPKSLARLAPFLGLGIYFVTPDIFRYIEKTPVSERSGQVEWTDTLNLIVGEYRGAGAQLSGFYANINTREDLLETIHRMGGPY